MDARIAQIENSQDIRLPELLDEAPDPAGRPSPQVVDGDPPTESHSQVRAGWVEAARLAHERGEDACAGAWPQTGFDTTEWEWESNEGNG